MMSTCRWCMSVGDEAGELLQSYCSGSLSTEDEQALHDDLCYCMECVVAYHRVREDFPKLHKRLWELETSRLMSLFCQASNEELEDDELFVIENNQELKVPKVTPSEYADRLRFPLLEILKYPCLMAHPKLSEMYVEALCKIKSFQVFEKYPGIYLLLVHPNETVRRWAISVARSLGNVDRDDFYDLQEIFSCMFFVVELGIFRNITGFDTAYDPTTKMMTLPRHLYDSANEKNYWLGICMLLTQLDTEAMDSLFLGPDKQANILHCIINTMDSSIEGETDRDASPFWPALQCFMLILDRLGSRIWCQIEPTPAFEIITRSPCYKAELEYIKQRSEVKEEPMEHDAMVTCSQMVYGCNKDMGKKKVRRSQDADSSNVYEEMQSLVNLLQSDLGQAMRIHNSTFLWFIPFATSVMYLEFIYIHEVIKYMCKKINDGNVQNQRIHNCDEIKELFTRILVYIIDLYLKSGCLKMLYYCAHEWVGVVVTSATLRGVDFQSPDGPSNVHAVSSTSSSRFTGSHMAPSNAVLSQACIPLILSLLKEGTRTTKSPSKFSHFLNLLNKQTRVAPQREWNLTAAEVKDLQNCLQQLIKRQKDGPSSKNTVPADALDVAPSPPTCSDTAGPRHKIKEEVSCDYFESGTHDGRNCIAAEVDTPSARYEPLNVHATAKENSGASAGDSKPPLQLCSLKPDVGKMQVLKSKLGQLMSKKSSAKSSVGTECLAREETGCLKPSSNSDRMRRESPSPPAYSDEDEQMGNVPLLVFKKMLEKSSVKSPQLTDISREPESMRAKEDVFVISDDDDDDDDDDDWGPAKKQLVKIKAEPPALSNLNHSPCRDYDGDLSESQLFAFETKEEMVSAWSKDPDCPVRPALSEPLTSWDYDTEPTSNENIERAFMEEEEGRANQKKLAQGLRRAKIVLKIDSLQKLFEEPEPLPVKARSKKPKESETEADPESNSNWIEREARPSSKAETEAQASTAAFSRPAPSTPTPAVVPPKKVRKAAEPLPKNADPESNSNWIEREARPSSISKAETEAQASTSAFSRPAPSTSTPAVVPPKKVRKAAEPQSSAEKLGLKKKKRKAFDLSQRSLDWVDKLRSHGRELQVERVAKKRRTKLNNKSKNLSSEKMVALGSKKKFSDQQLQFLSQSRAKPQGAGAGTSAQPAEVREAEPTSSSLVFTDEEDEDDDDDPLPCSQPDPERNGQAGQALGGDEKEDEDWMQCTQMDALDMEMCSQMEEVGELSDTQRDPVDMDIDSDDQEPTEFVKSGMSPRTLKKAKPSTTKIYATSSNRSAFLLEQEREKTTAFPAAASFAAGRGRSGRQIVPVRKPGALEPRALPRPDSLAMPPPMHPPPRSLAPTWTAARPPLPTHTAPSPTSRQPDNRLPQQSPRSVIPSAPVQAPRPVQPGPSSSCIHPPTYKTYPRPDAPVVARPVPPTNLDPGTPIQDILNWRFEMFRYYDPCRVPTDLCDLPLEQVGTTFRSFDEYYRTFYPLLLINTFEELVSEWLKNRESRKVHNLTVIGKDFSRNTWNSTFEMGLTSDEEFNKLYPREEDLVILWLPQNTDIYTEYHFGCVHRSNVLRRGVGQSTTLSLTIKTRGNVTSMVRQTVDCLVVGSLITTLREFKALVGLSTSPLNKPVVTPQVSYFTCNQGTVPTLNLPGYNPDQVKAVKNGMSTIWNQAQGANICLIHGPPGTGKSKTIIGLLTKLLSEGANSTAPVGCRKSSRVRVLLCAPSNAAIDNLTKKVLQVFMEKCQDSSNPRGSCGDINLVRIGSKKVVSKKCASFSLESQVDRRTKRDLSQNPDVHRRKAQLELSIDDISRKISSAKDTLEHSQLMEQKARLASKIQALSNELKWSPRKHELQTKIVEEAHIICCTLSSSGSRVLQTVFRKSNVNFTCVIVDEAGQATETETLIPMMYNCKSLVLVGDPEQLPPTVISQKAKDLNYGQSLIARLCKCLSDISGTPSPVVFLSRQYRMHPDICEFPSKYIYNKQLKTDRDTAEKRCAVNWPFQSYWLFDVMDGQEVKNRDSYHNDKEVRLVLLLLKLIAEKQPVRVGVITPYNAQKDRINKELDRKENKHLQVDVDTVDGFQGREMDCIIVSCVRANHEGGVGFLGSKHRMNVTITRAKCSLFILGHLRTLKSDKDWGAMINDASKRGTIIKTKEKDFRADSRMILKKKAFPSSDRPHASADPRPAPVTLRRTTVPVLTTQPKGFSPQQRPHSVSPPRTADRPTDPRLAARPPWPPQHAPQPPQQAPQPPEQAPQHQAPATHPPQLSQATKAPQKREETPRDPRTHGARDPRGVTPRDPRTHRCWSPPKPKKDF